MDQIWENVENPRIHDYYRTSLVVMGSSSRQGLEQIWDIWKIQGFLTTITQPPWLRSSSRQGLDQIWEIWKKEAREIWREGGREFWNWRQTDTIHHKYMKFRTE